MLLLHIVVFFLFFFQQHCLIESKCAFRSKHLFKLFADQKKKGEVPIYTWLHMNQIVREARVKTKGTRQNECHILKQTTFPVLFVVLGFSKKSATIFFTSNPGCHTLSAPHAFFSQWISGVIVPFICFPAVCIFPLPLFCWARRS